jgi:chromate transporter
MEDENPDQQTRAARLKEIALLFLRLGFTSFGGPAAQVALMEDEIVRRRKWLDRQHFLDLYSAMNVIPGPNSTELAIALGYVRAGLAGLLVAGVCFVTPAMCIIIPLAWAYVRFGAMPEMRPVLNAMNAAVLAILAATFWRLAKEAVKDAFTLCVAILASIAALAATARPHWQPELPILAVAALAGAVWYRRPNGMPLLLLGIAPMNASMGRLFLAFLKIGATLYGSGYVLVSYMRSTLVEQHGWITERELLDGIAVGQVTPGPLLTTATFVGYLIGQRSLGNLTGGMAGATVATAGIFLPSFILVAVLGGVLQRIRNNPLVRGALNGMNAAVATLILVVTIQLAAATLGQPTLGSPWLGVDPLLVAVTVLASIALLRFDLNSTWIITGAAIVGVSRVLLGGV